MRTASITTLVVVLLVALPMDLIAQEKLPILLGARVRVTSPYVYNGRVIGTLVSLDSDTLMLRVEDSNIALAVSLSSLTRLEMSRGRGLNLKNAGYGFLIGAATGAAIGGLVGTNKADQWDMPVGFSVLLGTGFGGGVGMVTGVVAGLIMDADRWEEVPLGRIRLGVTSHSRKEGLALCVSFAL